MIYNPIHLTVREVAMLKNITPQKVSAYLMSGKYKGSQVGREQSSWRIPAEQFKSDPNWESFLKQREEPFQRTADFTKMMKSIWSE